MKRNSVLTPPNQKRSKSRKKHRFSALLERDQRLAMAPRHAEVINQGTHHDREFIFIVKIYSAIGGPGSELMTLSCVDKESSSEAEIRFDERFPISIHFRKDADENRVLYAKNQIESRGGFHALSEIFRSIFPNFGI